MSTTTMPTDDKQLHKNIVYTPMLFLSEETECIFKLIFIRYERWMVLSVRDATVTVVSFKLIYQDEWTGE